MLSQAAIKTAANGLLKEATGLKVYGKEVTEGYSTPSLFVEVVPKPFSRKTRNVAKSGFTIKIIFFQETPEEFAQLQFVDTVKEAFGMVFAVQGRKLTVGEVTYDFIGQMENILQVSVNFEFYENVTLGQEGDIAKEMDFCLMEAKEGKYGN